MTDPVDPLDDDSDGRPEFCPYCQCPRKDDTGGELEVSDFTAALSLDFKTEYLFGCVFEARMHEGGLQFAKVCAKARSLGFRRGSFVEA